MIHLTYANRTEELLAALVQDVRATRAAHSPFEPLRLLVPNRNVETYVKLGLAQALGLAANLEVTFLRRLLGRMAEQAVPGGRLVDARQTEGHLLALLHDEAFLAAPDLIAVRSYLQGSGARPDAVDRRRCQLAAELAQLFDEYAASRPELLADWRDARDDGALGSDRDELRAVQAWQRRLWRAVFGPDGRVARTQAPGSTWLTLAELVRVLETGTPTGSLAGPLHVFGISYIARGYHRVLAALARQIDVRVYTLNPCREFWEDLETEGELRRRLKRQGRTAQFPSRREAAQPGLALGDDPFELLAESENLALRLWGRPGRENIRLLNQQTAGDFAARFVASAGTTLLGRVQDDILDRTAPGAPDPALRADGSLQVIPCPGVRRELEVVAAEIWAMLARDPKLRLNEVAVVVPEAQKASYLSHVGAVFAEAHDLPHSIVDLPLGGGHRIGDAIEMLLALPHGSFTRRELLPLLTHPSIMGRFPDASAAEWLRLAEELGIVHGADRADHAGTYIERDLLNWEQGGKRLALGVFMDESPADEAVAIGGERYLPLPRAGDEQQSALGFGLLARSLIEDARFAAGITGPRTRPLGQWLELIRGMLTAYLVPADPDEETLLGRCLAEIEELEDLPLLATPISYRVASELVAQALAGLGGARGQHLVHGVTVTSFVPMRAIPFKAVFIVGLQQGSFPTAGRRSELDLRAARRYPGDVSPREQDLYMFLETLLSTRERLVLSYVARDELSGAPLSPSSVILELRELLGSYLNAAELQRWEGEGDRPALRRYDDGPRVDASTLGAREARAKQLGRSLRAALPVGTALPDLPALRRTLPPPLFARVAARLGVHQPPVRLGASEQPARLVVPLSAIRQFLEDPLQGSARFRLRMREVEGDEEILDREDEAFETRRPLRLGLLRQVLAEALLATPDGAPAEAWWAEARARLDRAAHREELRGCAPTGFYAAAERPALEGALRGWLGELEAHAAGQGLSPHVIRFGAPAPRERLVGLLHPPFVIDTASGPAEITGRTELLVAPQGEPTSLHLLFRNRQKGKRAQRDLLRAFVDHLALTAAGLASASHAALVVAATVGERPNRTLSRFAPLSPERARAYLGALVSDMVTGARDLAGTATGVHPYLLPCEAIFESWPDGNVTETIEKLRDDYFEQPWRATFSSVFGPVPEAVDRHDPPPPEEAARLAEARFGLFFELLGEGQS